MILFPIVGRELSVAARRPGTYWLRCVPPVVATLIFLLMAFFGNEPPARMGQNFMAFFGFVAMAFCLLAGVFLTCDSISSEKRDGTLGFLFLTDLGAADVLLGKLTAASLHAFLTLVATAPALAIPLLAGGVSGGEFGRLLLVFAATLLFSLGLGMLVSSIVTDARNAIGGAFLGILLFTGVSPAGWMLLHYVFGVQGGEFLLWPSPVYAYGKCFDSGYRSPGGAREFSWALAVVFILGVLFIVAAGVALARGWRKEDAPPAKSAARFGLQYWGRGKSARRALPLGETPPFLWLACRNNSFLFYTKLIFIVIVPAWVVLLAAIPVNSQNTGQEIFMFCVAIIAFLHLITKFAVAMASSRRLNEDRRSGALELLLATPLPVEEILSGQKSALVRQFRGLLLALGLMNAGMAGAALGYGRMLDLDADGLKMFLELFAGGVLVLMLDFLALGWVGMWRGLNVKQHPRAVMGTWFQVVGVPWLAGFVLVLLLSVSAFSGSDEEMHVLIVGWFVFGVAVDWLNIQRCKHQLETAFRSAAART